MVQVIDAKGHWCILRMAPARTIAVVDSLQAAGIDAWTPRETQRRRIHRTRKAEKEVIRAIAPSFAFALGSALPDLLAIVASPRSPHPPFWIFRHSGRVPMVADRALDDLRAVEAKASIRERRSHRYIYPRGTQARIDPEAYPAFGGLIGVVEACDGKQATLSMSLFGRQFEMKVATWLLRTDGVTNGEPSGIAA